ncbi:MAG: phasin family protein [Pseudomonadota bacterium]|nr:phasin family protein [Pseudomonadota bacterium]
MFGKFSEQLKKSSKPMNSWMSVNAKMLEDLSQNQTELFTGLLSDSVKYLETVSVQTEAKGVFAANSEFAEAMRDRLAVASKGAYSTLSHLQADMKDVVKSSIEDSAEVAKAVEKPVAQSAPAKAPAKKAAPKPAAKAAPTPAPAPKEEPAPAKEAKAAAKPAEAEAKPAAKPAAKKTTRTRRTTSTAKKPATKAAETKSTN